jgi:hypothetical protein
MAVREVEDVVVLIGRYVSPLEVRFALVPAQVLQPQRAYDPLPARIDAPARLGRVAARQDKQQTLG